MKTDFFQSCDHCWVFQICWHIECFTLTASYLGIWNSLAEIPSPPLALFVQFSSVAQLCPTLCNPLDYRVHGILQARILECAAFLSPGDLPNPGLLHCRPILYQLSHKESPRILKWVAYPFSRGSSPPRNRTGVSCIAGRFFTNWGIREALKHCL